LERCNRDKDDQLKAISNNRTILHSNLQFALDKATRDFRVLEELRTIEVASRNAIIEKHYRDDAARVAKELQESLAVKGARLGRHRSGFHNSERWEDGHAAKLLQDKMQQLQERRHALQERLEQAKKAFESVMQPDSVNASVVVVGDVCITTKLEAVEALESVTMHLAKVARQEKDLIAEDKALTAEKTSHKLALYRVMSEDASRFRSRPKVRQHESVFLQRSIFFPRAPSHNFASFLPAQ
jgi:hypothetical protein